MRPPAHVSLDRALSKLGVLSRSEARARILEGRVMVNGVVVRNPRRLVVPERARIVVDATAVRRAGWRTIVLHKPRGTVTTRRDPEGRPTVFDLLGDQARGLVAVGRLDLATTGLLILTTDTQLANRLTDPASGVVRRYAVTVRGQLQDDEARRMREGIGGLHAESVRIRKRSSRETHFIVELTEGRNREIRRLCLGVGHEVTALKRIGFGGLELGPLAAGAWRDLTPEDVSRAFGRLAASSGP
jgi:23S rRNA pseudouridine2605 synthase